MNARLTNRNYFGDSFTARLDRPSKRRILRRFLRRVRVGQLTRGQHLTHSQTINFTSFLQVATSRSRFRFQSGFRHELNSLRTESSAKRTRINGRRIRIKFTNGSLRNLLAIFNLRRPMALAQRVNERRRRGQKVILSGRCCVLHVFARKGPLFNR